MLFFFLLVLKKIFNFHHECKEIRLKKKKKFEMDIPKSKVQNVKTKLKFIESYTHFQSCSTVTSNITIK